MPTADPTEHIDARLDRHLRNWADWMRSGDTRSLGAPDHATGFVAGGYSTDSDTMYRTTCERGAAVIMHALIGSLQPARSAAINHAYLHAVYRFPRSSFEAEFEAACAQLLAWMPRRGLV